MAELTFTAVKQVSGTTLPVQTLTTSDTVTLPSSGTPFIEVSSTTEVTLLMTGQGMPKTQNVTGYGQATFNNLPILVAANTTVLMPLAPHIQLLDGEITLTGAEDATVKLYTL